ncbi:MAG: pyrroline-5-carboxylate reductase [Desulfuromonas sp.]|nr:MAG: pyrroline-5-carboxylate reductase [Desulfuromonas sp.]
MTSNGKIGFVGGGNMAEAFIKGLIASGVSVDKIMVSEPNVSRRQWVQQQYPILIADDNLSLVRDCSTIVLAIKPQIVDKVVGEIVSAFSPDKLLISILAGVGTETLEGLLGGEPHVVRAMPNTPALVDAAASAICPGQYATEGDLEQAVKLFEMVGTVQQVDESQMDAVTGLSGSGPAFVYTVIEALADGGVQQGLRRDIAQALAVQTVLGSAKMVLESGEHPALLRDKVCSPAGTTINAIRVLEERGLRSTLMEAVAAATQRSKELGRKE